MAKIHSGLPDRGILDGDPSQYGLVKVTTCAVSGQLATEACQYDAMGYGTVTDWWAQGTAPGVYCQMHRTQQVCADSGMIAGQYCPSVVSKGVAVIPSGHPLYRFIGTKYDDVLEQYLGAWATVKLNASGSVVSGGAQCTYHNSYVNQNDYMVENTLIPDAWLLINQAEGMMAGMDPYSAHYQAISAASSYLQALITSGSPGQSEVANAMGQLTRAMAGLY